MNKKSGFEQYLTGERQRPLLSKKQLDEMDAERSESNFIESEERAAKSYWDSVIEW